MAAIDDHSESVAEALQHMHPELDVVRELAADPVYLVGGAVRDLLLGLGRADIDLVVEGNATALAERLGAEIVLHERFAVAKVRLNGHELDIASARSERYPHPGALPEVEPAATIEEDLRRRDFTINAMAISLDGKSHLIDPFGGQADLAAKRLRILHPRSFEDDPTRAIRAARYASRFGFELELETETLLRRADLGTVSADRRDAELMRLAGERRAVRAFELLDEWGVVVLADGGFELAVAVDELLDQEPWREVPRDRSLFVAALNPLSDEKNLAVRRPERPSEAVALAAGRSSLELLLARALGAEWLDDYMRDWRNVALEIDGDDLIAAGIAEGPALGRGLRAALHGKLDGKLDGREQELAVALRVARSGDEVA